MKDDVSPNTDFRIVESPRIIVLGTSGAGKTTLARQLAQHFGIPHVELDSYRHGPNWTETPDDIFRKLLGKALEGESWIADGNYTFARDVVWSRANTVIWLDYSFPLVFWRVFSRSIRRGITREELWNGNKENLLLHFFSKESLFLWVFQTYWRRRKSFPIAFAQPQHAHLKVLRFGSVRATRKWLSDITSDKL